MQTKALRCAAWLCLLVLACCSCSRDLFFSFCPFFFWVFLRSLCGPLFYFVKTSACCGIGGGAFSFQNYFKFNCVFTAAAAAVSAVIPAAAATAKAAYRNRSLVYGKTNLWYACKKRELEAYCRRFCCCCANQPQPHHLFSARDF